MSFAIKPSDRPLVARLKMLYLVPLELLCLPLYVILVGCREVLPDLLPAIRNAWRCDYWRRAQRIRIEQRLLDELRVAYDAAKAETCQDAPVVLRFIDATAALERCPGWSTASVNALLDEWNKARPPETSEPDHASTS